MPAPDGIPLARRPRRRTSVAVAAATDHHLVLDESLSSVMRSVGLHVTGGQRGDTGRPRARMSGPSCAPWSAGFDAPAEGRAAAGRFDVADSYAPSWWDAPAGPVAGHATRPGGRRLDPLQGKTPRARLRHGPRARGHPIEAGGATTGSGDHCFDSEM